MQLEHDVLDGLKLEHPLLLIVFKSKLQPLLGEALLLKLGNVSFQNVSGLNSEELTDSKCVLGEEVSGVSILSFSGTRMSFGSKNELGGEGRELPP